MNQFVASSSEMYEPVPDTADSHEFEDVVDAIVDHGLYSDDVLLLRLTERRCELAVPANIRRHWTINPFARWCDRQNEKPIAYRIDGFHIWPSDSVSQPYFAAKLQWHMQAHGIIVRFRTLEHAMRLVDGWFPSGRRVANPEWTGLQRGLGRTIRFKT